jgi:hypothetical protein
VSVWLTAFRVSLPLAITPAGAVPHACYLAPAGPVRQLQLPSHWAWRKVP